MSLFDYSFRFCIVLALLYYLYYCITITLSRKRGELAVADTPG